MGYSVCPVCHSDDSVSSIAGVVNDGTNTQIWNGYSYNPINSEGVTYTTMTNTNQTWLAAIFTPPSPPGSGLLIGFYILGGIIGGVIYASVTSPQIKDLWGMPGGFIFGLLLGFLGGFFPGIIGGILLYFLWFLIRLPDRISFNKCKKTFFASAYCYRDNVAWGADRKPVSPELYRAQMLWTRR